MDQYNYIGSKINNKFNQNYTYIAKYSITVLSVFTQMIKANISCLSPIIEQQIIQIALFILHKP